MKQAAQITRKDIQSPKINSISSTKVNSTESSSIQTPIFDAKNHNDIAQSRTLASKQDDEHHTTPSKCIPLAERLAQEKAKKLAALMESNNKDARSLRVSEQESLVQKKFFPFTFDQLKQPSTNTSSPSQLNQIKNNKTNTQQNPNNKLKSAQVQKESNNISFIAHPISPSNRGFKNI
jgi:hypothetical protein